MQVRTVEVFADGGQGIEELPCGFRPAAAPPGQQLSRLRIDAAHPAGAVGRVDDRDLIPLQKDGELFAQRREGAGLDLEDGTVARHRVGDKAAHADFLRVHVRLVKALEHGVHALLAHDAHASGTFEKLIILAQEAEALLPLRERAGSLHGKTPASAVRPIRSCRASLSGPEHRVCLGGNPAARRLDPMARARLSHGRGSGASSSIRSSRSRPPP